jgi:hypothetical protein
MNRIGTVEGKADASISNLKGQQSHSSSNEAKVGGGGERGKEMEKSQR